MPGRKSIPTETKKRAGNPGHRPLNVNEPKLPLELPKCPSFLSGRAKYQWQLLGNQLLEAGLMTAIDETALAALCMSKATWMQATEEVRKRGAVYDSDSGGLKKNPWVTVAAEAHKEMVRLLSEFGMTPSSRSRVSSGKRKNNVEEKDDWFGIQNRN
jgi:P27 family predicted phage terminase small subunit